MAEHRMIRSALAALVGIARRAERGEALAAYCAPDIVRFLRDYVEGLHRAREELIVFPAMSALGFSSSSGPIANLMHEHAVCAELLGAMERAIAIGLANGGTPAFTRAALEYARVARRHADQEERTLLPLVRSGLPPPLRRTLADALRRHRVTHAAEQERCLALLEPLISMIVPGEAAE